MTFGDLKTEVGLRLNVDGTSIYDYESWDAPATAALTRALNEFVVGARLNWGDRVPITLTEDSRRYDGRLVGMYLPELVYIDNEPIYHDTTVLIRAGSRVIPPGTPSAWARDTPYWVEFNVPVSAGCAALASHAISGWAEHPAIASDSTQLITRAPEHFRMAASYATYVMMESAIGDTASSQRAKANASNAFEFMRQREAEAAAGYYQR